MINKRQLKALVICAVFLALLTGCANQTQGSGRYICTGSPAIIHGLSTDEEWIELKPNGRGTLRLMSVDYPLRWTLTEDAVDISLAGEIYTGLLSEDVLTLSFDDMIYTYVKEGAQQSPAGEAAEVHSKLNALQRWWNGDWYGWWTISDGTGKWSELNGSWYDCCAHFNFDAAGSGTVSIWDEGGQLCNVQLRLSTESSKCRIGAASPTSGYFWSWKIGENDWELDPGNSQYSDMLGLWDGYYEDENGSFRYRFTLRPWGTLWDDVAANDAGGLPQCYYSWYLPLLEAGDDMPDTMDGLNVDHGV